MRASFAMATLALLAVVLLGWTASGALAHAVLEAAAPEDGSRLEASPAEIVLRFSEPVALTKLQLLASEGGPAGGIGHPETDGGTIPMRAPGSMSTAWSPVFSPSPIRA